MTPKVVIVGGGFGGLEAAKKLKNSNVAITLLDSRNYFLFQPLLYQVATAGLSPSDIASPIRSILRCQANTEVFMKKVTGVDLKSKTVLCGSENFTYDYLVLATGAHHSYFGHDEWSKLAPGLKTISDATSVRKKILLAFEAAELEESEEVRRALLTFVVVGAGPTGVELAGAISELARMALKSDFRHIDPRSAKIILIEAAPRILASFPESLAERAAHALNRFGVEIRTGSRVTQIDSDGVNIGPLRIPARTAIWAAGVAASPAAQWVGAKTDSAGRIIVNQNLTVGENSNVFAIGDTAHFKPEGKDNPLPGVSPVAMQEGRHVARIIKARINGQRIDENFKYIDKGNLATVGRSFAIASIRGLKLWGYFAWIIWLVVHIYYLIGFRNRLLVLIQWAWAYLTYKPGARLIVGTEDEIQVD